MLASVQLGGFSFVFCPVVPASVYLNTNHPHVPHLCPIVLVPLLVYLKPPLLAPLWEQTVFISPHVLFAVWKG